VTTRHPIIQTLLADVKIGQREACLQDIDRAIDEGVAMFESSEDYIHLGDAEIQILNR